MLWRGFMQSCPDGLEKVRTRIAGCARISYGLYVRRNAITRGCLPGIRILRGYLSPATARSEEHTSELQSLMRISYAVFCLKNKKSESKRLVQSYQLTEDYLRTD